ncbi:MAG: MFS transporter [Chloroflexia bacterium]
MNRTDTIKYSGSGTPREHGGSVEVGALAPLTDVPGAEATVAARPSFPLLTRNLPLPASLRALGHRNFRLFWTGQMISLVGTWMQMVARGWLVLELTHSPFWLGMVGFANSVPVLLLSLWTGELADKFSKRTLIIWTQVISMLASLLLAGLALSGVVELWHVLAISVVMGTVFAFDAPARQSFTVDLVGKEDLMNAVALNSAIFNGARVVGPALGAVALAWQGPGMAFLLNGLSYLAVLAGLFMMKLPPHSRKKETANSFHRIVEGLRYVRHDKVIGTLMILIVTVSIFAFPYATLMPIIAESILHVGEEGYGMLMAVAGVGSLVGALSLTVQSGRSMTRRGRIILLGAVGLPVFLGIFALSSSYWLSLAMLVGVGWTMISINATVNTLVQTSVPDELRGRVNGVFAFLFIGMAPAGNLLAGVIAYYLGAPAALFFGAVVCALVTGYIFLKRRSVFAVS